MTLAPPAAVAAPANGDLGLGLQDWLTQGREAPTLVTRPDGGPAVRLGLNSTILSPPFTVPEGYQLIAVRVRAPGVGALLEVSARPEDGAPAVPLTVLEPAASFREHRVPLAGLAGRTVRLVLDPVPALGRTIEVAGVGPVEMPLPLWTVTAGVPDQVRMEGRTALRVAETALALTSLPFGRGPGARDVIVAVRGAGRVTADAGAGAVALRAGQAWRDLRVPLPERPGRVTLTLRAAPGDGSLLVTDLGLVRRATVLADRRTLRKGPRLVLTGTLRPAGGGLVVEVRSRDRVARTRTSQDGRFRLAITAPGGPAVVSTPGDRTRLPGRWPTRLPPPRE